MATPYQRDAERVKAELYEQSDGALCCKRPSKILIPQRYQERNLASVSAEVYILGVFAWIIDETYYAVSLTTAMMRICPLSTDTVDYDGTTYLEFSFDANSPVIHSTDLVKNDSLTYYIYDEHFAKGRIPWYLDYFDIAKLFDTAKIHAGVNLGNRAILNLISSTMARDKNDLRTLYCHILKDAKMVRTDPPAIVPFRSVIWNTTDTTSKLIGAYFSDSMTSALVNPSDNTERIETLLRT